MRARTHVCSHMHTQSTDTTHAQTCAHGHTHTCIRVRTCTPMHRCAHILMREHTPHADTYTCSHTGTHMHLCIHASHTHMYTHACTQSNMLMHTHSCMHTHMHTCVHTPSNQIRSVLAILFPSLQNQQHGQGEQPSICHILTQTLSTHVCPRPASPTVTESKLCLPHEMNLQGADPAPLPMPTSGGEQATFCHPQPQNLH